MLGVTDLQVEVVSPAEVEAVHEGSASRVSLGILTLVVLQILVLVHEVPEELTIALVGELDLTVVGRDIHQVGSHTVAVHITVVEEAVAGRTVTCVEQGEVLLAILIRYAGDDTVGDHILRVLHLTTVRSVDGIETVPG